MVEVKRITKRDLLIRLGELLPDGDYLLYDRLKLHDRVNIIHKDRVPVRRIDKKSLERLPGAFEIMEDVM